MEENSARGPPPWFLAIQARQWINENPALYPAEEELPQDGPSFQDYAHDPISAD